MATAKKPATKKPARKPAKKTTKPTKVASKTAVKKASKKPSVDVKSASMRAPITPLERIRSLNIANALVSIIFAVLVALAVGSASVDMYISIQARNLFAGADSVVLGSAAETIFTFQYRYLLAGTLLVGAVGSLLLATKLRKKYEVSVVGGVAGLRWLFMGISSGLILQFVALIAGIQDIATLKLIGALVIITTLFGWIADRDNAASKDQKWFAFIASLFSGVVAWLPIIVSLIGTTIYSNERFGWHVYAIALVALAGFIGFAYTQYSYIKGKSKFEYTAFEQRYLRIDQVTKAAIVVFVLYALR